MNTRKYSKNQENRVAKAVKGSRQSNSGATPFFKGDVITDHFLLECKTAVTEKGSISIKSEWLKKLEQEAFAMRKPHYALAFNFGGLSNNENFYIINEKAFKLLLQLMEESECNL